MICTNEHFIKRSLLKDRISLLQSVSDINVLHRSNMHCCSVPIYLVKFNCAVCLLSVNDCNGARELLEQVLATMRQTLPADHVDVARGELQTCLKMSLANYGLSSLSISLPLSLPSSIPLCLLLSFLLSLPSSLIWIWSHF